MSRSVEVVVSELDSASARLHDAGQRLQDGLSGVDLEVGQLLGSGWKGTAASAYGPEWEKWHNSAGQVVRGLQAMSDLLKVAGKEYAKTDQQGAEALGSSMQGAGGSAGGAADGGAGGQGIASSSQGDTGGSGASDGAVGPGGTGGGMAHQMNLEPMTSGLAQAGQVATGFAQQAGQAIGGMIGEIVQIADEAAQQADDENPSEDTADHPGVTAASDDGSAPTGAVPAAHSSAGDDRPVESNP